MRHLKFCCISILTNLLRTDNETGGEFKSMNSSGIVYPYLSTSIGKPFLVSIFLFCSLQIKS